MLLNRIVRSKRPWLSRLWHSSRPKHARSWARVRVMAYEASSKTVDNVRQFIDEFWKLSL